MIQRRRLYALIDDERHERIQSVARQRGLSVSAVVREAIDSFLALPDSRHEDAAARILVAEPMRTPAVVDDLLTEIRETRDRRR